MEYKLETDIIKWISGSFYFCFSIKWMPIYQFHIHPISASLFPYALESKDLTFSNKRLPFPCNNRIPSKRQMMYSVIAWLKYRYSGWFLNIFHLVLYLVSKGDYGGSYFQRLNYERCLCIVFASHELIALGCCYWWNRFPSSSESLMFRI